MYLDLLFTSHLDPGKKTQAKQVLSAALQIGHSNPTSLVFPCSCHDASKQLEAWSQLRAAVCHTTNLCQ